MTKESPGSKARSAGAIPARPGPRLGELMPGNSIRLSSPAAGPGPAVGRRWLAVLALFAVTLGAGAQPGPHLAYVYPAGGKIGTTFQVAVGGQFLMSVSNAFLTGPGITAAVIDHHRPMNQKEFNDLRDRLRALQEKLQGARSGNPGTNVWTAADARERMQIRDEILRDPPNRTANPAMIDTVTLKVCVAANAPSGEREIRLATPNALSNPLRFCVGTIPEASRTAAQPANPDLAKYLERIGGPPAPTGTPKYEAQVQLPVTLNGQIMPGGIDHYRFFARRGQQLIITAAARSLIPYLADAVPGWFEAVVTVHDAQGRELACDERFRFKPDPVIRLVVPADGEYTVDIHDSIFRGREDFVYRLTIGELPYITGIFPLGGPAGQKTTIALAGWNLPAGTVAVDNTTATPGVISLSDKSFNEVLFAVDDLPECLQGTGNHSRETAQRVTLPVTINGHVGKGGEAEVFQFQGAAGQKLVAEVYARRLDSPLDSFLRLTDAGGKQLAFNDDFEDKGTGLNTFHADSYLTATLPADGTYFVQLTDTQGQGGPEYAYRLRLSEPRPDFALRLVPSSLSLRTSMSVPVTVYALRRDGFTNAISLSLRDAPPGFSLSGAKIPAGQDQAKFTLKAPSEPTAAPVALTIEGLGVIGERTVIHPAIPAENMMQAFFYWQLVPSQQWLAVVNGPERRFLRDAFKIVSALPVKLTPGGTAHVRVSAPAGAFSDRFRLELDNPPDGITLTNISAGPAGLELVFSCDAQKVKPGASGNLICEILPRNPPGNAQRKGGAVAPKLAVATLPAVPFTVSAE